jgi:hypothetical protein
LVSLVVALQSCGSAKLHSVLGILVGVLHTSSLGIGLLLTKVTQGFRVNNRLPTTPKGTSLCSLCVTLRLVDVEVALVLTQGRVDGSRYTLPKKKNPKLYST